MPAVTKWAVAFAAALALYMPDTQAAEYFRGRTIIGAGVFVHGDKSILLVDISGDKSNMPACASTGRFAINGVRSKLKSFKIIGVRSILNRRNSRA